MDTIQRRAKFLKPVLFVVSAVLLFLAMLALPAAADWHFNFRPATLTLLRGDNPYNVDGFFNPPWALLPLLPFAPFPEHIGAAAVRVLMLAAFVYTMHRLGASPAATIVFLLSPAAMHCLISVNLDWLALLGFVLPPRAGLFLLLVKPQVGAALALYRVVEAWRAGGLRRALWTLAPVALVTALSFLLFGFWPTTWLAPGDYPWNDSLWPGGIPVGLVLLALALTRRWPQGAMAASPFLSPYTMKHSWMGALAALAFDWRLLVAGVAGQWASALIAGL